MVRNKIKMFAQKKVTLPPGRHKIVILDEADRSELPRQTQILVNYLVAPSPCADLPFVKFLHMPKAKGVRTLWNDHIQRSEEFCLHKGGTHELPGAVSLSWLPEIDGSYCW